MMRDTEEDVTLTDKSRIDVLEMSKIPKECDGSPEWIWGSLFKADEEDEFDMLASRYPEVQGAVAAIKELSADPDFRYQALQMEKARRDWISGIDEAKTQGIEIGHKQGIEIGHKQGLEQGLEQGEYIKARSIAQGLLSTNLTIDEIARLTSLTREEVDHLRMMNS